MIKMRSIKIIAICISSMFSVYGNAQVSRAELLKQINSDIWLPFLQGVNQDDAELYNSVHSKDFYWVAGGTKTRIMNFKEYVEDARKVMSDRKQKSITTTLHVRFLERNINEEFASEKCVIQYVATEAGKPATALYSIIHVFSKKENGVWRKYVQYVNSDKISSDTFESALPLEKID